MTITTPDRLGTISYEYRILHACACIYIPLGFKYSDYQKPGQGGVGGASRANELHLQYISPKFSTRKIQYGHS
jgi:hypothetical protein